MTGRSTFVAPERQNGLTPTAIPNLI
jgi:hypothetical protein